MSNRKKVILYPNAERDLGLEMTLRVSGMLKDRGCQTVICQTPNEGFGCGLPPGIKPANLEVELSNAEMIITFGGDGTILRAARAAADTGVPILGMNLGGKGFMAELESMDIGFIDDVAKGKYKVESRMMLDVEIHREGEAIYRDFALNDVVVRGDNKVIDLILFGDGQRITHFSGDGVVIATPAGSTAYSMAAGGPIVEEAAENIILTPICAHVIEVKSFVLVSDRRVSVELGNRRHNPAFISVDGGDYRSVERGDVIYVYKSERYTHLVRLSNRSFYEKVSEKLGERP
ncbi:MAG: NAD(+)/NADH kinase [Oscillospiraceae bacterium]|nr:NAD(+)/NADH kinase [Oscillospiraceae bacterium]